MSGSAVKCHTRPNKGRLFFAKRKTSYLLLSPDCPPILVPVHPLHRQRRTRQVHLQVQHKSEVTMVHQETGAIHQKPKTKLKRDNDGASGNRLRDLLDWFEEFTENLEDTEVPATAHIFHDSDSERPAKVPLRKHSVYRHFPKDRFCDVCLRTKMTRAPCRRRTGEAVPRAEKFGDLITADHKVLNEEGESRNNHRYAVVVHGLATQWIQSYPCKTKTSQETEKSARKFLEPSEKPKVIYTDDSWEFGKSCEDLSCNHRTSTPHRSETNGIAERAVRRVKAGTSAVSSLTIRLG